MVLARDVSRICKGLPSLDINFLALLPPCLQPPVFSDSEGGAGCTRIGGIIDLPQESMVEPEMSIGLPIRLLPMGRAPNQIELQQGTEATDRSSNRLPISTPARRRQPPNCEGKQALAIDHHDDSPGDEGTFPGSTTQKERAKRPCEGDALGRERREVLTIDDKPAGKARVTRVMNAASNATSTCKPVIAASVGADQHDIRKSRGPGKTRLKAVTQHLWRKHSRIQISDQRRRRLI